MGQLRFEKAYGNVSKAEYLNWFSPFAVGSSRLGQREADT